MSFTEYNLVNFGKINQRPLQVLGRRLRTTNGWDQFRAKKRCRAVLRMSTVGNLQCRLLIVLKKILWHSVGLTGFTCAICIRIIYIVHRCRFHIFAFIRVTYDENEKLFSWSLIKMNKSTKIKLEDYWIYSRFHNVYISNFIAHKFLKVDYSLNFGYQNTIVYYHCQTL